MSIRDKFALVFIIGLSVSIPLIIKSMNSGGFIDIRQKLAKDFSQINRHLDVLRQNIKDEFFPRIRKPISTYPSEEKLVTYFPEPFGNFTRSDWDKFWNFIYGTHVTDDYGKDFFPKRRRQLTKEELKESLAREYPMPFSYFQAEHWQEFWKEIVKYGE